MLSSISRDYYEVLGLSRTATTREIKQAFYKLSKKVGRLQLLDSYLL